MWNYKGMFLIENNKDGGLAIARYLKKKKNSKRNHNAIIRIAKRKKADNTKCWGGLGATAIFTHSSLEYKLVQPL